MSAAFVGTRSIAADQLQSFLQESPASSRYYFLRWLHRVSGFINRLPETFPSPEGEMLTPDFEMRWRQTSTGYDLLLLAHQAPEWEHGFQPLQQDWIVSEPLKVHPLPKADKQDTRFPNAIDYPSGLKLQQRYFQNKQTETVHFISLTLFSKVEQ
ncbi:MAG: hypothetical protein MUF72_23830 [Elainella sp. Prado103]|nr:hypothetical protein [Elainella sp. Prado103]